MVAAKDRIAALEDEAERRQVDANNELFDEFDEFDKQQWAGRSCSMANGGRRNCCTMRSSSVFFKKNSGHTDGERRFWADVKARHLVETFRKGSREESVVGDGQTKKTEGILGTS